MYSWCVPTFVCEWTVGIQRSQELKCPALLLSFSACSLEIGSLIKLGARLTLVVPLVLLPTVMELKVSMAKFS